jgi:hypothetical protein
VTDELTFGASLPNRGVTDEMATRSYFSIMNRDRYFDFMAATAENPVPLKYIITKGSKTFIALSDKHG